MRIPLRKKTFKDRRRSGAVIVELALCFIPFIATIFAIADFSMPIFLYSTFTHAVREGCRYGIAYQTTYNGTTYGTQTDAVKAVVQNNAMGFLAGATGLTKITVKYYSPVSPFGDVTGTGTANANGNIIEVSIGGFSWFPMAPVLRSNAALNMSVIAADRLESLGPGTARPAP